MFTKQISIRRIKAFEEYVQLAKMADRGQIVLPPNLKNPPLKSTRRVEKINRQIKEYNDL